MSGCVVCPGFALQLGQSMIHGQRSRSMALPAMPTAVVAAAAEEGGTGGALALQVVPVAPVAPMAAAAEAAEGGTGAADKGFVVEQQARGMVHFHFSNGTTLVPTANYFVEAPLLECLCFFHGFSRAVFNRASFSI